MDSVQRDLHDIYTKLDRLELKVFWSNIVLVTYVGILVAVLVLEIRKLLGGA